MTVTVLPSLPQMAQRPSAAAQRSRLPSRLAPATRERRGERSGNDLFREVAPAVAWRTTRVDGQGDEAVGSEEL